MALTVVSSAATNAGVIGALPTHAIGDIIVYAQFRNNTTQASKPAAAGTVPNWIDIDQGNGTNGNSVRTAYAIATATNHTSGTWTNGVGAACIVLRGQHATTPIGGHARAHNASSSSCTAPAITLIRSDGSSQIVQLFAGPTTTPSAAPAGYTRQAANSKVVNTKDVTTSDGSIAQVYTGGSFQNCAAQIEILAPDVKEGHASGSYGWASSATGKLFPQSAVSGTYAWVATVTGKSQRNATSAGAYNWSGAAVGRKTPKGVASGSYQWEATEVGDAEYQGQGAGSYVWGAGTVVGETPVSDPTASGAYGWSSTKVGYSARKATVASNFGWVGASAGKRVPKAVAGAGAYGWGAGAFGATPAKADAALGGYAWIASAIGHRTGDGFVLASYRFTGLATGHFTPKPVAGLVGWISE